MSRKDYELIARVMSSRKPVNTDATQAEFEARHRQWSAICECLVDELLEENKRFDSGKFLTACEYYK